MDNGNDLTVVVAVFIAYLVALFGFAIWARAETRSVDGYFIAGKRLPYWVAAFSTNATGESGWLLLGLTGMAYVVGIHALWVVLGEVVGIALSWTYVARRLKHATDEYDSITIPDYLESRFDDRRHILRLISVVIILAMVATYAAAQMVAAGKAFSSFLHMSYGAGVVLGAVITLLYTTVGGFKAVAYTDLLQGVMMLLGLLLVPAVGFAVAGGADVFNQLHAISPALMSPWGEHGASVAGIVAVASFIAIGLPFLGVPQLMVRYIALRDATQVRQARAISVLCMFGFGLGAVFTGMVGRILVPEIGDPETILPTLAQMLFHPVITGLLVVVVLAAIMSTVDSLLILASSAVVRDVLQKVLHPALSERQFAYVAQAVTVALGLFAMAFALTENRLIFWFVLFAWSGLGAAFGPVLLCSLWWRGTTLAGAVAGMVGGFGTAMLWVVFAKSHTYGLYEAIPGFGVGFLLTVLVSRGQTRQGQVT